MRTIQLARNLSQGVRALLAALLLIFAINSVAAAAHDHKEGNAAHATVCGYCVTFGSIADGPVQANGVAAVLIFLLVRLPRNIPIITGRPLTSARARAPPAF